jgi:dolichol kinase
MPTFALVQNIVRTQIDRSEIRTEILRKSIHMMIALVPLIAALAGRGPTLALLACGVLFYTYTEVERFRGRTVPFITRITRAAARDSDNQGRMILGPVTLGIGAMVSLLLYPEPAAVIAIYSLAFGDAISSIVGKTLGRVRLPLLQGKSLEGSLACFVVVFFASLRIIDSASAAGLIALTATVLEAVPVRDMDNILMPVGTGFVAGLFLV